MLKKLNIGFPSEIPVGFVEQSLALAEEQGRCGSQFILSFDGKLVAPGCKGERTGDSDMLGVEGPPPNLSTAVKILKKILAAAKSININVENNNITSHYHNLRHVVHLSTLRIKRLRGRITGSFYLRKRLIERCGNNQELQYKHRRQMSTLNQNTAECESVVRRLLEVNMKAMEIMAAIYSNTDVHIGERARHIMLIEHANNFQLLPPEIVQYVLNLDDDMNIQFVKQCSEKWFQIRKQARVTGSTLNAALGFDTLQKQKQHHYIHVRGRQPPPVTDELQKKFDHGTKNEVNAIATLISTVVPAYLPACYAFYEVGPAFVGCDQNPKLLEVSADGILQCSLGQESCPNYHIHSDRKIVVEIKSPTPQENVAETLFYEIPNRYVPQVQSEMKAYGCLESWLICSTVISASVIVAHFDPDLWKSLWDMTSELYVAKKQNIPTKLHQSVKQLKIEIASSKSRTTKLLCEVPTVTGEYGNITVDPNFSSPYSPAPGRIAMPSDTENISRMSENLSVNATSSFQECHQVLRDPGKELLVFMITDKDRKQQRNIPYSYPVAYALKGACMNNSHLQYMVDKVRTELWKRNIPILCETYDSQWHKHITENKLSMRLTKLHGKDTWNKCCALSKDKCIEKINQMSIVKKSTLQQILSASLDISHGIFFLVYALKRDQIVNCLSSLNNVKCYMFTVFTQIHGLTYFNLLKSLMRKNQFLISLCG